MNLVTLRLAKLSVCPCGFPLLKDGIPLGQLYTGEVDRLMDNFILICGGCGRIMKKTGIWTSRPGARDGFLPIDAFDIVHSNQNTK